MLWDGHCATSVCERLGISSPNLVDRWKKQILNQQSLLAGSGEQWVWELEVELRRVEQIAISRDVALSSICDVLSVSRSDFYAWQSRDLSVRDCRDR